MIEMIRAEGDIPIDGADTLQTKDVRRKTRALFYLAAAEPEIAYLDDGDVRHVRFLARVILPGFRVKPSNVGWEGAIAIAVAGGRSPAIGSGKILASWFSSS